MGECIDASVISPFILNHEWPATGKPALELTPLNNYPLMASPAGDHQVPELFRKMN